MMYCPACKVEYPEELKSCPRCGSISPDDVTIISTAHPRSCAACGRVSPLDAKFCLYCGHDIAAGPRVCRTCGTIVPLTAKFCGECSAAVTEAVEKTKPILPSLLSRRPGDDSSPDTDKQTAKTADVLEGQSHQSRWRVVTQLALLLIVAFASYQLGRREGANRADAPVLVSVPTPPDKKAIPPDQQTSARITTDQPSDLAVKKSDPQQETLQTLEKPSEKLPAPREEQSQKIIAPPRETASSSPQSLPPSSAIKPYVVTTSTSLRDKPTWRGKELVRLEPQDRVQVSRVDGDWLYVESELEQPAGYIWYEDAKLE